MTLIFEDGEGFQLGILNYPHHILVLFGNQGSDF